MKKRIVAGSVALALLTCLSALAQTNEQGSQVAATDTQQRNLQEYVELMRADVRQQKAQILGASIFRLLRVCRWWSEDS